MPTDVVDIRIATDLPDHRALIARLCDELGRALAREERWEREDAVVPWHASAATFDAMPERVVEAILEEWDEVGDCLAGIEFSGYLETDHGPRAWGCLMVHEGRPRVVEPELTTCTMTPVERGYRLEARLNLRASGGADA